MFFLLLILQKNVSQNKDVHNINSVQNDVAGAIPIPLSIIDPVVWQHWCTLLKLYDSQIGLHVYILHLYVLHCWNVLFCLFAEMEYKNTPRWQCCRQWTVWGHNWCGNDIHTVRGHDWCGNDINTVWGHDCCKNDTVWSKIFVSISVALFLEIDWRFIHTHTHTHTHTLKHTHTHTHLNTHTNTHTHTETHTHAHTHTHTHT